MRERCKDFLRLTNGLLNAWLSIKELLWVDGLALAPRKELLHVIITDDAYLIVSHLLFDALLEGILHSLDLRLQRILEIVQISNLHGRSQARLSRLGR